VPESAGCENLNPNRLLLRFAQADLAARFVAAMIRFAHAQGLAARDLTPEELFHSGTRAGLA